MTEEIIHIARSEYDKLVETAKKIQAYTDDQNEHRTVIKFIDRNNFPTVKDMEKHNVKYNMRKFLPYLIFYSDPSIYTNDDPKFAESQVYIQNLISMYVDVVDDADFAPVLSITPGVWKKSDLNQRAAFFRALIGYYGRNEFETFVRDIGWKKFMTAYNYSQKEFAEGKRCNELREDLAAIWDLVHDEPFLEGGEGKENNKKEK